jgi:glutathione S-transferase
MYELYVANKNYSSWSVRPWVLLRELKIAFNEHQLYFGGGSDWDELRQISPSGKVPCLVDGAITVWDSLAIVEYLAEHHRAVWPPQSAARAWARSAAAEMHSGFNELRSGCSMSCGVRLRLKESSAALEADLTRISALWNDGLRRFGGPFLGGAAFTAVDAFFAPVAYRVQTYGLALDERAANYVQHLLRVESVQAWYAAALQERQRDAPHEREILQVAEMISDFRAK